jgi:predicted RND superfamily exporter protein
MSEPISRGPGIPDDAEPRNLAAGIERIGVAALRIPVFIVVAAVVLAIAAVVGFERLKIDDSLGQLFRSNTPEYQAYLDVTRRFPSNEFDVLIVIEGNTLLERSSLEKLRNLALDLQLIEGTRGLISIFSARQPPEGNNIPPALFPEPLPEGAAYDALIDKVRGNEIIRGKLLSEDAKLTLMVLALDPAVAESSRLAGVIDKVRAGVDKDLAGTGLTGSLSGVPVMQQEIRNAIERDRLVYNTIGFAAGCLIAILFFRRVSFMVVAAAPPLLAILLSLGALGWLDFRLNMFLNVMTPLIMVISFSDSMQLTFAARDRLIAGEDRFHAFRNALFVVGPACVLTHATAGISFIALQFSSSDLIRTFGQAGLIATVIALVAVLTLVPVLGVLLVRNEKSFASAVAGSDTAVDWLRRLCAWIAHNMVGRPGLYSLLGFLLVAVLSLIYLNLEPRYRLADQVPDQEQAVRASHRLDAQLTGANPIDILVEFPQGETLYSPETLATIGDVHAAVEKQAGLGNVWSLETLRRWLREKAHRGDVATLKQYVDILPKYLTRRFISEKQDAVVVSARIPDVDASKLRPIVHELDQSLDAVRAKHPGYRVAVTGLSVVAARNSADMIDKLSSGLTIEIVFVAAFIGFAFRSWMVMLMSILPGIFPIVLSGTLLYVLGYGLQFASVVALTVSFGLGLSATIHFLNRLQLETRAARGDIAIGVERATVLVGPPLILTSAVLTCGLVVTVFSNLPSLKLFGWLSAFAMVAALMADLFILRPTAVFLSRFGQKVRQMRTAQRSSDSGGG